MKEWVRATHSSENRSATGSLQNEMCFSDGEKFFDCEKAVVALTVSVSVECMVAVGHMHVKKDFHSKSIPRPPLTFSDGISHPQ